MKKRSPLVLLLAAAVAVSFPTSAAAAVVTFDLTRDNDFAQSIGSGTELSSDRGTTLILTNFASSGNVENYWRRRGSMLICARLSIWNTPIVSARQIMSYTRSSPCGMLASVHCLPWCCRIMSKQR